MNEILVEIDDPVATITLNRPETLNALTFSMLSAFREAVDDSARDPRVVGIVVTGAGRGFCSGLDAAVLQQTATAGSSTRPRSDDVAGMFTWLLSVPKPIVSAVNGVAAGGGFVLAVMSDLRIASRDGSFMSIFSKRGLVAEHGTTWIVPRLIGTGAALDLLWSSRKIDATEAHRVGLVQQVVQPDDLLPAARRYVVDLAEHVSPASLADTKRLVYEGYGVRYPEALDTIDGVQYAALDRVDAKEGAAALVDKRAPELPPIDELMDFDTIRYEVTDGLCRVTLHRPEHMNAMTNQMVREAHDALHRAAADRSIRVLVLTGSGRAFCPGADLNHFTSGTRDEVLTAREFEVTTLLHELPAVTIAAINGACAGAGLGWALACDVRLMAASAKLNTAFLDVAVAGDMAIPWSLPRIVGAARARDLSFFPRRVEADEAERLGLVARVFADDTFRDDTESLLSTLLEKSPTALRGLKENYLAAEHMTFADFTAYEAGRHLEIAASADTAEAFRAFVEKRKPVFR